MIRILAALALLFTLPQASAAQSTMGLLGVSSEAPITTPVADPAAAPVPPPEPPPAPAVPEDPYELARQLERARDNLKRARERSAHLAESIPGYAPGGYWDLHYRKEVASWERSLVFAEKRVRDSRSFTQKFKRFMATDIITGRVTGHREDWAADSSLRMTNERLAQARAQRDKYIPEGYVSMQASKKEVDAQIPGLEAALVPLEAKRVELNARGIKVLWNDKPAEQPRP